MEKLSSKENLTFLERLPRQSRRYLVWGLWFITWIGLLAGLFNLVFYEYVVLFSAIHAILFLILVNFRVKEFPAQIRIAYLIWVAIGTYVPYMTILMYITTIGLATNLFLGYCPLARIIYLLPINREEPFSLELVIKVFFSPHTKGQFKCQ